VSQFNRFGDEIKTNSMNLPLIIGALIVSLLLLWWLLSVIKASFKTAFLIVAVIFTIQVLTGVGPQQIFNQVGDWIGVSLTKFFTWLQRWGDKGKIDADPKKQSAIWLFQIVAELFI
jgi:hypothetical protein